MGYLPRIGAKYNKEHHLKKKKPREWEKERVVGVFFIARFVFLCGPQYKRILRL